MEPDVEKHGRQLARDGIVMIEDYLDGDVCDDLYNEVTDFVSEEQTDVVESGDYSYGELANWDGAVVLKRTGSKDDGMIDVFNIDQEVDGAKSIQNDEALEGIVSKAASTRYSPDNINAYWNESVMGTRGFHADTYSGKFKSFVYLTDVPDRSYGPFVYVKGSHRISKVKLLASKAVNKLRGTRLTDAVFYDESDTVYCTAPKGTLIIANQAGYHRGHPQEEGMERMLLTSSYTPDQ